MYTTLENPQQEDDVNYIKMDDVKTELGQPAVGLELSAAPRDALRWLWSVDGQVLTVDLLPPGCWSGAKAVIRVNDVQIDQTFTKEGMCGKRTCIFDMCGRAACLESKGSYPANPDFVLTLGDHEIVPALVPPPLPGWVWVFVVLCILTGLGFGILGGACGGVGAVLCLRSARRTDLSTGAKVGVCLAITAGAWLMAFLLAVLLAIMLQ